MYKFIRKKNNNVEKGITLIALVITIIVLLILAGVTIATLTGENGILTKAESAKEQTIIEDEKESISLAYTACKAENYSKDVTDTELQEELEKIKDNVQVTMSKKDLIILYQDTQHKYKLTQDGKIEQIDNSSPEEADKIVNMLGLNIGVTAGGKVVYFENTLVENKYTVMNTDSRTTITENGVKKSDENCFIDNKGKVYTWGYNTYGKLGDGTTEDRNIPVCISDLENDLKGKNIVDIHFGVTTVIALDDQGKIYTWGDNDYGQLGDGNTEVGYNKNRNIPKCISDLENDLKGKKIVQIYSFNYTNTIVVLDDEGNVYTWGDNNHGELGDGSTDKYRNTPKCISIMDNELKGKNIVNIQQSLNGYTILALDNEGKIYTWGSNRYGQLGDGTTNNRNIPTCISDLENDLKGKNIVDIYLDLYITTVIALDDDGKIYTWGENDYRQLGDGTTNEYRNTPKCISNMENDLKGKNIVDIYLTVNNVIALDDKGKVYTWGDNDYRQLGDGSAEEERSTPTCISDMENDLNGKNIARIYEDESTKTVLALDNEGKIYTWGNNKYGQLGDGNTEVGYNKNRNIPKCISNMENDLNGKNIVDIHQSDNWDGMTIIALDDEGNVYTWGNTRDEELGNTNIPICLTANENNALYNRNIDSIIVELGSILCIDNTGEIIYLTYTASD